MELLHISKPRRKSNFWDWEQSTEPFLSQVPPGFVTAASAARGTEPTWLTLIPHPSYFVFQWCVPASRHFQQHPQAPHLWQLLQPISRKAGASIQTHSSTSRQSSPRSRSSRYTSGQHKPRIWGCCSRKPGTLGGSGASHLQGHTHRTC